VGANPRPAEHLVCLGPGGGGGGDDES